MRAIDTNVLVRILTRDDSEQADAADAFLGPGAWVSTVVLIEAVWALKRGYGFSPRALLDAIEMLLEHEKLTIQDSHSVKEALELFRARPSLGFADCLILELARKAGHLPLGTFDRVLGRVAGAQKL